MTSPDRPVQPGQKPMTGAEIMKRMEETGVKGPVRVARLEGYTEPSDAPHGRDERSRH